MNARVAVAIGDVNVARIWRDGHVGWPIERPTTPLRRLVELLADGQHELAIRRPLANAVLVIVDGVDEVVGRGVNAMCSPIELAFAERPDKVAVLVENDDGVLAAVEHIDVVVRVDGYT